MRKLVLVTIVLVFLSGCGYLLMPSVEQNLTQLPTGNYRLDPSHTTLLFKVTHFGISTFVGRFNTVDATLIFDSEHPENSELHGTVEVASIDVNAQDFEETLRGCSWLCVKKYPKARFETKEKAVVSGNELVFSGNMTFRGVTAPIKIHVIVNGGADSILTGRYSIGFDARFTFLRSDFGMGNFAPAVSDKVNVEVYTEFQKQR